MGEGVEQTFTGGQTACEARIFKNEKQQRKGKHDYKIILKKTLIWQQT